MVAAAEEDLWNIMGLQGNPLRGLLCMTAFLIANILGIVMFLAIPLIVGRALFGALGASLGDLGDGGALGDLGSAPEVSPATQIFESPLRYLGAFVAGYFALALLLLLAVPCVLLLLGALLGQDREPASALSHGLHFLRAFGTWVTQQAWLLVATAWAKVQLLAGILLQLVLVPCFVGHVVVCLLCGPVLHMPQHVRASLANANMPLALVLQLFVGYVHLWGVAFLEGCVEEACALNFLRLPSANFFLGTLSSHRRLFGSSSANIFGDDGGAGGPGELGNIAPLLLVPKAVALKVALVLVALHTPLVFVLWYLPARLLDTFLGEWLFPVRLLDHVGSAPQRGFDPLASAWDGAAAGSAGALRPRAARARFGAAEGDGPNPLADLFSMPLSAPWASSSAGAGSGAGAGEGGVSTQAVLAMEMLQLYILVLQCLRLLDASHVLTRLVASWLRSTLRRLGFGRLLSGNLLEPAALMLAEPVEARIPLQPLGPLLELVRRGGQFHEAPQLPQVPQPQQPQQQLLQQPLAQQPLTQQPLTQQPLTQQQLTQQQTMQLAEQLVLRIFDPSDEATAFETITEAADNLGASHLRAELLAAGSAASGALPDAAAPEAAAAAAAMATAAGAAAAATAATPLGGSGAAAAPAGSRGALPGGPAAAAATAAAAGATDGSRGDAAVTTNVAGHMRPQALGAVSVPVVRRPLPPMLWDYLVVASLLTALAWSAVAAALSLPLSLGRLLASYIISSQAKKISDFLPLSLGVVALSAGIFAVVKVSEALPVMAARAAEVEHRRYLHLLACGFSSLAMIFAAVVLVPIGVGTLSLSLLLPLKARSVYHVPTVFVATDCWSLGLVLTKVVWLLVQTDVIFHALHLEFVAIQSAVNASWTDLTFDLPTHRRIWRTILMPLFDFLVLHFVFPQMVARTLVIFCIPEDCEFWRAAILMYCHHVVAAMSAGLAAVPIARESLSKARQRIFDAKYLVSTELQNYHQD